MYIQRKIKVKVYHFNVSMKDILKITKEFVNLPYKVFVRKRPKHEPTDRYFYPERQLSNCMMRADAFNSRADPVKTEITGTQKIRILYVCDSYES